MLKHNDRVIPFKQEKNTRISLFCFHHGGGSASIYREWAKHNMRRSVSYTATGAQERFNEPLLHSAHTVVEELYKIFMIMLINHLCSWA